MRAILDILKSIDAVISKIIWGLCSFCMGAIFVMFIMTVFIRFFPIINIKQTDELTTICLVWMIFYGSQELVKTKGHFVVDIISTKLEGKVQGFILKLVTSVISSVFFAVLCYYGVSLVLRSQARLITMPFLKMGFVYSCIPISAFFMAIYSIGHILQSINEISKKNAAR